MRPIPELSDYRIPSISNVYLCSSGSHPGPGVSMAPGRNAAMNILADLNLMIILLRQQLCFKKSTLLFFTKTIIHYIKFVMLFVDFASFLSPNIQEHYNNIKLMIK